MSGGNGMLFCPSCGENSGGTRDSRKDGDIVRRRRHCNACGHRWSTIEVHVDAYDRMVSIETRLRNRVRDIRAMLDEVDEVTR